jgi:antitoxin component YwqK of YwqJK toxin-antitoxin module
MRTLTILLIFLIPVSAICQTRNRNREVIFQTGDTMIRAQILTGVKRKKMHEKRYYWYSKGIINSNTGGYSGNLLHGYYKAFQNNILIESGNYHFGLREGKWIKWYKSGKIEKICSWEKGLPRGEFISYKEDGTIRQSVRNRGKTSSWLATLIDKTKHSNNEDVAKVDKTELK